MIALEDYLLWKAFQEGYTPGDFTKKPRDHKSLLNSSHDFFDSSDGYSWVELVNFWFYAPNFAEVTVIKNFEFYIV